MRTCASIRMTAATALAIAAVPSSAGAVTIGTLPPVTVQVVNNGAGNQTDPHVSGDLVSYTSEINSTTSTEVRYHDLVTGADAVVPGGFGSDFLSDVSGSRIVFTRVSPEEGAIYVYDTTAGTAVEVDAGASPSNRYAPAIGSRTVAFQDFSFTTSPLELEATVHELDTGITTRVTNNTRLERDMAVSPDGNAVVFDQCNVNGTECDVVEARRSDMGWTTSVLSGDTGELSTADTNGALVAYTATRAGETDIFIQSAGGSPERQLSLTGQDTQPNLGGSLIAFHSAATTGAAREIYVYDPETDTLYRLTNTADDDESLSDISVSPSGLVRIVYHVYEAGNFNVYARSFALPRPLAAEIQQPIDADGTSVFNAKRGVVPVKFALTDDGSPTCELPPATLRLTRIGGASPGPVDESLFTGSPDSGPGFRIADCHYHYNLNPRPLGPGSYLAEILIDGAVVGKARFELK